LRVQDIFDEKHLFIYEDELATKARATIRDFGLRILPVIDEHKRLLGMVSRQNVMTISSSLSLIRVKGIMQESEYVATVEGDAFSTMKEMIKFDEWNVPVVNSLQDKTYRGVLGFENFIDAIIKTSPEKLAKPVSEIMSKKVISCSPDDEVDNVWRLMQNSSLAGCPVAKNNKIVGIITEKDLLASGETWPTFESSKGRFRDSPKISSIMTTLVTTVNPSVKAIRVAKAMVSKDIGRIPVVDEEKRLVGIVDREAIVKLIVK
jgi:CBS domain-containing protein